MPTPFTHLEISHRLLNEAALSEKTRHLINQHVVDFLLGGIIADARPEGTQRQDTHFYHYTEPMPDNPWREMFRQHPSLEEPRSERHHAFLAGYVAHLAVDEYWSRYMLKPHFGDADWGVDIAYRFFSLHLVLITMDERDEKLLDASTPQQLYQSEPDGWLPFLTDNDIREWRDFIAHQLETQSQTLSVFGKRIKTSEEDLRKMLDDTNQMQVRVWDNIPPLLLKNIEAEMYKFACKELEKYMAW